MKTHISLISANNNDFYAIFFLNFTPYNPLHESDAFA
jgi:hypothetical protein